MLSTVYNVVSLDDADVIEEMILHFKSFWNSPESVQKSVRVIQQAVQFRTRGILNGLKEIEAEHSHMEQVKNILSEVQLSLTVLASKLAVLTVDDFLFAFHPAPHASVGHLHMHVLAMPQAFRQFSTSSHDWKTVPAQAVLEVLYEEKSMLVASRR